MEAIYENNEEMIADFGSPGFLPVVSMTELYNSVYESKPPIVDGLLYPGTYLFVGSPKYGKSFLMLQLTYHISAGLPIWGYAVRQGTVLYLSLEDDQPRLQSRLYRMFKEEASNNLFFSTWAKNPFALFGAIPWTELTGHSSGDSGGSFVQHMIDTGKIHDAERFYEQVEQIIKSIAGDIFLLISIPIVLIAMLIFATAFNKKRRPSPRQNWRSQNAV